MNIKEFLNDHLKTNKKIYSKTADKKIFFLKADTPKPPYVEYEIIDEYGTFYDENKKRHTTYVIQIDIFSNKDYYELEKIIKEEMSKLDMEYTGGADLYEEPPVNLFHKAMIFEIDFRE